MCCDMENPSGSGRLHLCGSIVVILVDAFDRIVYLLDQDACFMSLGEHKNSYIYIFRAFLQNERKCEMRIFVIDDIHLKFWGKH